MTDTPKGPGAPDLDALARQYMDLWQKQLAGLAQDEAVAQLMARSLELMNTGLMNPAANPFLAAFTGKTDHDQAKPATGQHAGAKAASASNRDPDHDVADLTRRIHALEKRIAELEAGPGPKRKRAAKKTAKR